MTVKRSVNELFLPYFRNVCPLLRALPPDTYRGSINGPRWETEAPDPLICPPLEKILQAPMDGGCQLTRSEAAVYH